MPNTSAKWRGSGFPVASDVLPRQSFCMFFQIMTQSSDTFAGILKQKSLLLLIKEIPHLLIPVYG
jgi:hypothetical protein